MSQESLVEVKEEIDRESYYKIEYDAFGIPLLVYKPLIQSIFNPHGIVIIYGGSKEPDYRFKVAPLAEALAHRGFTVFTFDFRSNLPGNNFYDFGLRDRYHDAISVISKIFFLSEFKYLQISLMGISMGGEIAARIAWSLQRVFIANLILVAPAAYSEEVFESRIKFGPEFTKLIQPTGNWRSNSIFNPRLKIKLPGLVFQFLRDTVVPDEVVSKYFKAINSPLKEFRIMDYPHKGNFENPKKIDDIASATLNFINTVRRYRR